MKKKTKMKTKNIIQRLCLFLFVLVLAAPAWATDYGRLDYETFRSRNTVKAVGTKKPVRTLRQGRVERTMITKMASSASAALHRAIAITSRGMPSQIRG